ncbi:MAG TPA: FG-GAP-like repeat-containing protein [Saprospiraceae bacterium]|nr:FG-GAP-like repeat-containing protein [Saprospiraceae bacterium]
MKFLPAYLLSFVLLSPTLLTAQIKFVKNTSLLTPPKHYSAVVIGVSDMNDDGYDDLVRLDKGNLLAIDHQTAPGHIFARVPFGKVSEEAQWGVCMGDLDNDGFPEILTGGPYDHIKLLRRGASGSYSMKMLSIPNIFLQTANFADINNDGWLDAFLCNDDSTTLVLGNDGTGALSHRPEWINVDAVSYSKAYNSGNYGSLWSDVDNDGDLDLYIAKCRQGVSDPTDPRRINQLFWNNGDGSYTQDTLDVAGLRIGAQSWTADFGDIDNDGDFDCFITNHDVNSQLLENDGHGKFTDISLQSGIAGAIDGLPIQGVLRDFDNDGYLDIIVAGTNQHLLHNNRDKTFSSVQGQFDAKFQMESYAIGDLNHDGFLDVYAGYGKIFSEPSSIPDALWMNAGNSNHYLGLRLRGTLSNRNAIGAKAFLYSHLGKQVREVRSGESYGISNSHLLLFGLGDQAHVDSVVVHWPAGGRTLIVQPKADQYLTVVENTCTVDAQHLQVSGPATFCNGDSVTLKAPDGFAHYHWNNGDTTQQISVKASGHYAAELSLSPGCSVHTDIVGVVVNPIETPRITAASDSIFCQGGSIDLSTSRPYAAYLWSTGDTTASIRVTQSGAYTVRVQGLCEAFISDTFRVNVLAAPAPITTGAAVQENEPALLSASGTDPRWYDAPSGGSPFFTGNQWTTPPLTATDTFWVDAVSIYDRPNQVTGMPSHSGTSFGDVQFNGAIIFDCFTPFKLARVQVYTNTAGQRRVILQDNQGKELQGRTVSIPTGQSTVTLDFDIPIGEDLRLTTDTAVNLQSFSTMGPRLRRSDQNVKYPYEIPEVLSIKGSNFDEYRYYYFFAWVVDYYPRECVSERVPVVAQVKDDVAASEPPFAAGLRIYPNPTEGGLRGEVEDFPGEEMTLRVRNALGELLRSEAMSWPAGPASWLTDLSDLPAGCYWIELAHQQGTVQRRVVLSK